MVPHQRGKKKKKKTAGRVLGQRGKQMKIFWLGPGILHTHTPQHPTSPHKQTKATNQCYLGRARITQVVLGTQHTEIKPFSNSLDVKQPCTVKAFAIENPSLGIVKTWKLEHFKSVSTTENQKWQQCLDGSTTHAPPWPKALTFHCATWAQGSSVPCQKTSLMGDAHNTHGDPHLHRQSPSILSSSFTCICPSHCQAWDEGIRCEDERKR